MQSSRQRAQLPIARPLYGQVRDILLERINRGDWSTGDSLPNEFLLASEFGVSIGTLRRAIEGLEDAGVVIRRQGRGTYVSASRWDAASAKYSFLRLANDQKPTLSFRNINVLRRPVTASESLTLMCSPQSDVYDIEQLLIVASKIVGFERILVHVDCFPDLDKRVLKEPDLQTAYAQQGLIISRVTDQVGLAKADKAAAALLLTNVGSPLLVLDRLCFGANQKPLEITCAKFLPEIVRYSGATSWQ